MTFMSVLLFAPGNRWDVAKIGQARRDQQWYNFCQFWVPAPHGGERYFVCSSNVLKAALKISQNFSKRSYAEPSQQLLRVRRIPSGSAKYRVLRRGEEPIALTPKAFEVPVLLIQHSGEVTSKDELMKAVWPDSFVVHVAFRTFIYTASASGL
jgi:hypothetical protein